MAIKINGKTVADISMPLYQQAVEKGYTGTEEQFYTALSALSNVVTYTGGSASITADSAFSTGYYQHNTSGAIISVDDYALLSSSEQSNYTFVNENIVELIKETADAINAANIGFNNLSSTLISNTVQDAIDEIDEKIEDGDILTHVATSVTSSAGVHGIRYNNNTIQVQENGAWTNIVTKDGYRIMTAKIDLSNSDPAACVTYADDATTMTAASSDWDTFFGHYPVLFKDGKEVGQLNPDNFAQFKNGTTADITSGDAGDVMIAFPRRGVRITTSGSTLTVSMTDNPNDPNFTYYAHTRGTQPRDVFYLGAYKGYTNSSKLHSLSGVAPTVSQTISTFRTQAHNMGDGYENSGFYQLTYRQVMYILKYKNLNSQAALGQGYVGGSAKQNTGATNANGMDYGDTSSATSRVKLFGLEDFWGNVHEWIDGVITDSSYNILVGTDNFNNSGTGYTSYSSGITSNTSGYMKAPQGTSETGFVLKTNGGSSTTYFADYAYLYASRVACFGGNWANGSDAGAFRLTLDLSASYSYSYLGARLMYL